MLAADSAFKAVVADCFLGDHRDLVARLRSRGQPFVLSHRGSVRRDSTPEETAHAFHVAPEESRTRNWRKVTRHFREGHTERWGRTEFGFLHYGPNKLVRPICPMTDRQTSPYLSTWYLTVKLPLEDASFDEVVRLYGLRHWVDYGYKQMKDKLRWADFMGRNAQAIRQH